MKFELSHDDAWDWEIGVLDGQKVAEGHSLNIHDWLTILEKAGVKTEEVEVADITESKFYQS